MNEKIRRTLTLFQTYRDTRDEAYNLQAEAMLDELIENCNDNTPLTYSNGLCGIGVAIEYLLQHSFIEGDADEILSEIDQMVISAINNRPHLDTGIANGLLGLAYYLYERLCYRTESETPVALLLKEHTIYLIDWIEDTLRQPFLPKDYYEYYFILVLLHQLNIFNAKVIKLLEQCDKEIENHTSEKTINQQS